MTFQPGLLNGQVALVTGGGTGIGEAISLELARHGAEVVVASRNPEHHADVLDLLRREGRNGTAFECDVRDPEAVSAVIAAVSDRYQRLDIVVNNAAGNFLCRAEDLSPNGWRTVVDIVLNGTFLVSRESFRLLKESRGAIVNIGAPYAESAAPLVAHSGAAKAGILNLTRTLAVEWARFGIRVNTVTPGPIAETEGVRRLIGSDQGRLRLLDAIPLNRLGKKEEVAAAVLYLLSPAAAYVTGQNLVVDGGLGLVQGLRFEPSESQER
ncbi:MAG TPA: SDR family oxidoreductase, partial [Acidobacteriota bacterium]|nr:SDR family oxidoreductase [Acidobacteriota bacterium]